MLYLEIISWHLLLSTTKQIVRSPSSPLLLEKSNFYSEKENWMQFLKNNKDIFSGLIQVTVQN